MLNVSLHYHCFHNQVDVYVGHVCWHYNIVNGLGTIIDEGVFVVIARYIQLFCNILKRPLNTSNSNPYLYTHTDAQTHKLLHLLKLLLYVIWTVIQNKCCFVSPANQNTFSLQQTLGKTFFSLLLFTQRTPL